MQQPCVTCAQPASHQPPSHRYKFPHRRKTLGEQQMAAGDLIMLGPRPAGAARPGAPAGASAAAGNPAGAANRMGFNADGSAVDPQFLLQVCVFMLCCAVLCSHCAVLPAQRCIALCNL